MRRTLLPAVIIVALATPARAQAPRDTVQGLAAIRADLETVKSQLTEVLRLLRQRPIQGGDAPTGPVRASVADAPTLGRADAPVTLVEFSDYQCPFCARSEPLVQSALAAYPTQARLVYKHFPLTSIHPQALPAALAAAAAQKQGKFWEMHEKLFANQRALAPEQMKEYARQVGLDVPQFERDMQSDEVKALVQDDIKLAQRVGVRGTPTIFVNGKILQNRSLDGFKELIDPVLKGTAATPNAEQAAGS